MAKLAQKVPEATKTVVSRGKDVAEAWYIKPINLGTIQYREGYWFTADNMRFVSSRDAADYLIKIHELSDRNKSPAPSAPVKTPPARAPVKVAKQPVPAMREEEEDEVSISEINVNQILNALRKHPEVREALGLAAQKKQTPAVLMAPRKKTKHLAKSK